MCYIDRLVGKDLLPKQVYIFIIFFFLFLKNTLFVLANVELLMEKNTESWIWFNFQNALKHAIIDAQTHNIGMHAWNSATCVVRNVCVFLLEHMVIKRNAHAITIGRPRRVVQSALEPTRPFDCLYQHDLSLWCGCLNANKNWINCSLFLLNWMVLQTPLLLLHFCRSTVMTNDDLLFVMHDNKLENKNEWKFFLHENKRCNIVVDIVRLVESH